MGHPPLIADNTHTTRLPADVEEDKFTPSCMSLPTPEGTHGDSSFVYFGLKLRLARLVKNVKKQTFRDPLGGSDEAPTELSIDHAGIFEGEVASFLQELPAGFRLEIAQDLSLIPRPSTRSGEGFVPNLRKTSPSRSHPSPRPDRDRRLRSVWHRSASSRSSRTASS